MKVDRLAIPDVVLITPPRFGDSRGFFSETYNAPRLRAEAGIELPFVQDNHSFSKEKGVVRGLGAARAGQAAALLQGRHL